MDPRREEGKALQQPFDVRILRVVAADRQPGRNLRVAGGKFRRQITDDRQLAFVVREHVVAHAAPST